MKELIDLIRREFRITLPLTATTPLISSGLIDSLRVAELLLALETKYGRAIDPRDVGTDNFDTPAQMLAFLEKS